MIRTKKLSVALSTLLIGSQAFAAGFEKTITWSGKHAGMAGIGVATAKGAEALYFNPAGIGATSGTQISGNFSPVFGKFEAPFASSATAVEQVEGKRTFSPIFGVLGSHAFDDKLAVGLGVFVSGGTRAEYDAYALTGPLDDLNTAFKSSLSILEISAGPSYAITDDLRIGFGLRYVLVNADFDFAGTSGTTGLEQKYSNLSKSKFGGVRAGLQYAPKDSNWGLGVTYRTAVDFEVTGDVATRVDTNISASGGTPTDFGTSTGAIAGKFPMQVGTGFFYDIEPKKFRIALEYSFTEYATNRALELTNNNTMGGTTAFQTAANTDITLSWRNQHVGRVGFEYMIDNLALRAGYAYTSQVTDTRNPLPTLASPGTGHSITIGAGAPLADKIDANLGLEYSMASGEPTATDVGPTKAAGKYSSNAFAAHVGVNYNF